MTERESIIEIVNKLFIYTDNRKWTQLQDEVFTAEVFLDIGSMGGGAKNIASADICALWDEGFQGIDFINHLGGNYLVTLKEENSAEVFAYATATHYKESAVNGKTREFVGNYILDLKKTPLGWRISSFTYQLKYMTGNLDLS